MSIPELDAAALLDPAHQRHTTSLALLKTAAVEVGFMTLTNTEISAAHVNRVLQTYQQFFALPIGVKASLDMATTNSNRGWGAPGAEQVDPAANPDYKEVFDCGLELSTDDPLSVHNYYAPNRWPEKPVEFKSVISDYYVQAATLSLKLLQAVALSIGEPEDYFNDKFDKPMALLRGNYYPPRPADAGSADYGIAPHTDYGCLTLLATDGSPGLEIQTRKNDWIPVSVKPGTFVINFGEMLQIWTGGRVVATPHRVVGGPGERLSIPFFFNPRHDVNIAPPADSRTISAGEHLSKRYNQTYVHRQKNA